MVDSWRCELRIDETAPNVRVLARDEFGVPTAFAIVPLRGSPDCAPPWKVGRRGRGVDVSGWTELGYTTDDPPRFAWPRRD